MAKKSVGTGYVLWGLTAFGLAGIHRFYLGRPVSGVFYLLTWGFLGVGSLIDLFLMRRLVDEENALEAARAAGLLDGDHPGHVHPGHVGALPPRQSPEKQILRVAANRNGVVTPQLVALETDLSLADARATLKRLVESGDCDVDVGDDGSEQYRFAGLVPSNRLLT
jgi:hypothetical protein